MRSKRVAVVGGGPGGLMTAYYLQQRLGKYVSVVLYEAGPRLGGKIATRRFDTVPVRYEAGAAELYDYSHLGPDPLKELIQELGLTITPMRGEAVVIDGVPIFTEADVHRELGPNAVRAIRGFNARCREACSPDEYYESDWRVDNEDPLSRKKFSEFLDGCRDPKARRYLEVAVHSDVATEAHRTSAMYGIQNWLMNDERYMRLYTIDGGIERLPQELTRRIEATVRLKHRVETIGAGAERRYRVESISGGETVRDEFDFVVAALPTQWLSSIRWEDTDLATAVRRHHEHYDHPAHYLRVTLLFDRPFWREFVSGSYFISDAFGGCCVYDESLRDTSTEHGVLGWLLAGEAATAYANLDEAELTRMVFESLPMAWRKGEPKILESRVHRWLGAVNGMPMGYPIREPDSRHQPDPVNHPGVYLVGDYLFDSTLNGVVDSADTVVEFLRDDILGSPPEPAAIAVNGVPVAVHQTAT